LQKADLKNALDKLEAATALPGPLKGDAVSLLQRVQVLRKSLQVSTSP
jgi:hypothetical protein